MTFPDPVLPNFEGFLWQGERFLRKRDDLLSIFIAKLLPSQP